MGRERGADVSSLSSRKLRSSYGTAGYKSQRIMGLGNNFNVLQRRLSGPTGALHNDDADFIVIMTHCGALSHVSVS